MKRGNILLAYVADRHIEALVAMIKKAEFAGIQDFVDDDLLSQVATEQIERNQKKLISYGVTDI